MYMPGTLPGRAAAHPERWAALCELYGAPQQVRAPAASMPSLSDAMGEVMLRLQLERGQIGVVVSTDAAVEATGVDLVVTRGS